jgi:NAD(P)-dependent dehydrogenase (short-subunit alcohol dehydrogenase family)
MQSNAIHFSPAQNALQDKVILITGAGDGIGKALAIKCAELGAHTLLLGRTEEKLAAVYDKIKHRGLPEAAIIPMNLEYIKPEHMVELAQQIDDLFGKIDGIVHCAGILGELTLLSQYPTDLWQQVLQINLTAPFMLTQALIPLMNHVKHASVIFTSSSVGRMGRAHWGAYSVSKFGIEGLTQIWAQELAETSGIRVNVINPGATRTLMRARAYPFENPNTLKTPEQILGIFLYLLCDDSIAITGQSFDAQPKPPL